jgi:hypothetical protein
LSGWRVDPRAPLFSVEVIGRVPELAVLDGVPVRISESST